MQGCIRDFRDLILWQKAIAFVKEVYLLTRQIPKEERFGLIAQLHRSAVSVPSNIAEGHTRQGKEFGYYLSVARGSLSESETQLIIAVEVGFLKEPEIKRALGLAEEIRRMSSSLRRKIG